MLDNYSLFCCHVTKCIHACYHRYSAQLIHCMYGVVQSGTYIHEIFYIHACCTFFFATLYICSAAIIWPCSEYSIVHSTTQFCLCDNFNPHDAMLARVIAIASCLVVRPSVTRQMIRRLAKKKHFQFQKYTAV